MLSNDRPPFDSPYYPYKKVIVGSNTLKGAELIPYKILAYLMDLPDQAGYVPKDDNEYPRCRLKKYLWYDESNPLSKPMPTTTEVKSLLFSAEEPVLNDDEMKIKHPKGYRLFAQRQIGQSITDTKTMLKIYPGRILDTDPFKTVITMQTEIWTSYALENNLHTDAYDRTFNIEQCLRESLNGVNIAGVGVCVFSRVDSSYNGSEVLYTDSLYHGRMVYFTISWSEGGKEKITAY